MSLLSLLPLKFRVPKQVVSASWKDRNTILNSDVNFFSWRRSQSDEITNYLKSCPSRGVEPIKFATTIEELPQNLSKARTLWDSDHSKNADVFWIDVYNLATDFLAFSEKDTGTVHLKVIDNNACTKFHTDGYSLRLFTTYYGSGTEWLPEKATNRKGLGKSNESIVRNNNQIQRMDSMEVGILKGEIPNSIQTVKGIVHRSPEISNTGKKRVILRIDL